MAPSDLPLRGLPRWLARKSLNGGTLSATFYAASPPRKAEGLPPDRDLESGRHGHLPADHGAPERRGRRGRPVLHGPPAARQAHAHDPSEEGQPPGRAEARGGRPRSRVRVGEGTPREGD